MAEADQEKTEQPTARRKRKAREKGDVAKSEEVNNTIFFALAVLIFTIVGKFMMSRIKGFTIDSLTNLNQQLSILSIRNLIYEYLLKFTIVVSPFAFTMLFAAFLSSYIQVGWLWTTKPLEWKWTNAVKFDIKQFFKAKKLIDLLKSLLKIIVLTGITYLMMRKELQNVMNFIDMDVEQIFGNIGRLVIKMILSVLYFYIFLAIGDYAVQRYQHIKKLKMTKQEVKDERKQMEGDPQIESKLRSLMMEESRKRMMADVPKADVVITNPTHIAIAIEYNQDKSEAPVVIAKGKRLIAQRIKEIAKENDIPIVEDKPLARMLYQKTNVGDEIDFELYEAVAEILAYVYNLKGKRIKE